MAFATKYLFKFNSQHGVEHQIHIQKDGYSGSVIQRALGRSPKLKKKKNGCICGTSLEIYAECLVDGEFAELYTSNPQEFKVLLYRAGYVVWEGFVSPELYSEPSIAPPYDVQIVATDGLGELKRKYYATPGAKALKTLLIDLLAETHLSLPMRIVSQLAPYQVSAANFFNRRINLDFMEGETYYDVLTRLLDSLHMTITQHSRYWYLVRETDLVIENSGSVDEIWISTSGTVSSNWESSVRKTAGKMGVADMWPVGNLSTAIEPALRSVTLQMPWHIKNMLTNPDITSDTGWTKERVRYNEDGYGGYNIGRKQAAESTSWNYGRLSQGISVKQLTSVIKVSAKVYRSLDDSQLVFTAVKPGLICYLAFIPSDSSLPRKFNYRGYWEDTEPSLDNLPYITPNDDGEWENGSVETASEYEWTFANPLLDNMPGALYIHFCGNYIRLYAASMTIDMLNRGYQDTVKINNDARGEGNTLELVGGRFSTDNLVSAAGLEGIWLYNTNLVTKFSDSHWTNLDFLSITALGYALSIAMPRLRTEGKLDIPSSFTYLPWVIKTNVDHLIETYEWDIHEDELSVSAISLPAATLTIESETVKEITGGTSGGSSSSGSGSGSGGGGTSGATMAEVQQWVTAQGYLTEITSAMVIAALGYVPASSSVDTQLFALAAPPTLTRRKGWTGHSTAGNMEDCIKVSHRLIGVEGFEAVLMVYRKRNSRSYMNGSIKVWKNKKGWAVAAGNYDICGYVPLASSSGYIGVQDLRTFILKRFVQFVGLTAQQVFDNMTATALDTTYRATTKSFTGPSSHMRFGIAMRTENPEFRRVVGEQTTVKDTCMEVYSQYTSKYEPRYLYSAVAPITAFLRTEGEGNYRNKLDFSLLGDSANVMININGGDIDFVDNSDPRSLYE